MTETTKPSWLERANTQVDRVHHEHCRFLRAAIDLGEATRAGRTDLDLLMSAMIVSKIGFDHELHKFLALVREVSGYWVTMHSGLEP